MLVAQGVRVSTVKHAHHGFDMDRPGKDSWHHREAGASEVLVGSAHRWALLHEIRDEPEPDLPELLARLSPVDLVLVEGFKRGPHAKIEVYRAALGKPRLHPEQPGIVAVASAPAEAGSLPWVDLDDIEAVAGLVLRLARPAPPAPSPPAGADRLRSGA